MILINIALGLVGLGIVVFFHELGHFAAARFTGINVEAFSIGWGNAILKKKIGNTEYRLGMFPIGGYCKMQDASDHSVSDNIVPQEPQKGSYYAASPQARILVCLCGPLFNLIFAILLLSVLWGVGFEINTLGNKIVLASELDPAQLHPADIAGLQTGDRIIEIDGRKINYFHELQESFALNPNKSLPIAIERNGVIIRKNIIPSLDKSSGAGRIGIIIWSDPLIENVINESPAFNAGLRSGDIIKSVNGEQILNNIDFLKIREQNPEEFIIEYERGGSLHSAHFKREDIQNELGFSWAMIRYRTPRLSIPAAIAKGVTEGYRTLTVSITSLRLLFMGIDLTKAVSGPIRITYMMGDMATQGFGQGLGIGFRSIINFLALISIALCVMNLLPLPVLDGGMTILLLVELIRRKPIPPKAIAIFQTSGMVIIFGLMLFALYGDIMFFARR